MSTQPNSARLFKYSRMNSSGRRTSMSEYEPKETFKLAAIRSITKGVKYNDLSIITGTNLNKLRVQETQPENLQYVTSHNTLASIRKKHDQIKRNRVKRESDLENMKEQLAKLKEQERQYLMKKANASQFSKDLEKDVVDKKLSLEEAIFQSRSMTNMIHRIKQDRVTHDQRKYNLEKQLEFLKKKINIVKRQEHSVGENSDRTRKVYEKLTKQLQIESRERMEHLANIEQSIQVKQDMMEVTNAREGQIADIAERAMQDKDQNEKNWKKLLGTHKFVSVLLREKMQREMNKFKIVETAFKNIKIATGTADTVQLVDKFLNKETVYGELLSKIADSERKIESLKHQHDGLEKQCRQIEELMNLFEITKKGNQDLSKEFKQLENYEDKSKRSELLSQKFFQWVLKQLRKIYKQQGGKIKSLKYGNNQIKDALEELFVWLETNNLSADETFTTDIHPNTVNSSEMDNLMRVKVKKEEDQDGDDIETTVVEEDQYVSGTRNDLLRQNDKFMKELKKKAEALMKLRIEMAPKKKQKQQVPSQVVAEKLEQ